MAILKVQGPARNALQYVTSLQVSLDAVPKIGDLLIAAMSYYQVTTDTLVSSIDQPGVSWRPCGALSRAYSIASDVWIGTVNGVASQTLTVNMSSEVDTLVVDVFEYSGLSVDNPIDKIAVNWGISSNPDTGTTPLTTQNEELWIGVTNLYAGISQSLPTNGFTLFDGQLYAACNQACLEKIVSSRGIANCSTTASAPNAWSGSIVTLFSVPPALVTLTYQSTPISVPATVNGQVIQSGGFVDLPQGSSVTVIVPPEVTL